MKRARVPVDEQETVIVISHKEKIATVYSSGLYMINRLEKYINEQDIEVLDNDKYGIKIKMPMKWIKIQKPQQLTEEQLEAARRRGKEVGVKYLRKWQEGSQ